MSDPVTLLLPFRDGLYDLSPARQSIASIGVALDTAQSKFYGKSAYLNGTGYFTHPTGFISGSTFTIELWIYATALPVDTAYIYFSNQGFSVGVTSNGAVAVRYITPSINTLAGVIPVGTWAHLAVVHSGANVSVFVNGVQKATASNSSLSATPNLTTVGAHADGSSYLISGYLQDVRITNGIARYTEDFTPPDALYSSDLFIPVALAPRDFTTTIVLGQSTLAPRDFTFSFLAPNPLGSVNASPVGMSYPQNSGDYRITGAVKELGKAGKYRLRLFDRQSSLCVRETWSALDGSYCFDCISDAVYFIVAYDHGDSPLNASIADNVQPSAATNVNFDLGATTGGTTVPKIYYGSIQIASVLVG